MESSIIFFKYWNANKETLMKAMTLVSNRVGILIFNYKYPNEKHR